MEPLPEVIITSGSNISVFDAQNGSVLVTYKENRIAPRTLTLVGEDYLMGARAVENKLKVWALHKGKNIPATITCPGTVNVLTVTSCGTYCVAAIKEKIYIWMTLSGKLLNVVTRHYQDITCLRFSSDDALLISGGKDGHVIVWILSQLIAVHIERERVKPRHVWNHHSSEVTDICPGSLGCVSRVATTSLDMTCKVYEVDSGILLSTICLDVPLTSVVMDTLEYYIFIGASNGCIYKINTYDSLPKEYHFSNKEKIEFKAHEQKVTSLSISLDGEKLMSASDDKCCRMWNIASMTCLINLVLEGGITNAILALKPTPLLSDDIKPQFLIAHFEPNFDDSVKQGLREFTRAKVTSKPSSYNNFDGPDELYSNLLRGSCKIAKDESNKPEQKHYEDIYQESIHGGTVNELKVVNNQMYSYLINHGLDNLPQEMPE